MMKFYVDGPFGQVHCREWGGASTLPPIICLAPSPFSGKAYLTLAPLLAEQRRVIAIDYPGYGLSDHKSGELSVSDLASVTLAVADHCSPKQAVDLLGFHTGTLVAAETSILSADRVNKLVLVDVPFFDPEKQAKLLAGTPEVIELSPELGALEKTWQFCVTNKLEHVSLSRAFEMFLDHVAPGERGNKVFRAAFNYPCEQRFQQVASPVVVIATQSSLYDATCNTAAVIEGSTLVELLDIKAAVLEAGAQKLAQTVLEYI